MEGERTFSTDELCQLAEVNPNTLRQWTARGQFKPEAESDTAARRNYNLDDAVTAALMARLTGVGITAGRASVIAEHTRRYLQFPAYFLCVAQGPDGIGVEWQGSDQDGQLPRILEPRGRAIADVPAVHLVIAVSRLVQQVAERVQKHDAARSLYPA